jgi:alkylhydroperoxidase family enzyme
MPRIDVPVDQDPLIYAWTALAPNVSVPAAGYSDAIYKKSSLGLREFESARLTMARINDCALCLDWRSARDVPERMAAPDAIPEEFYEHVGLDPDWEGFTERERLASEFARRYSTDHLGMDDDLWDRLHAAYSDAELVDLALCTASWLALGRFNRVFDIDGACRIS